MQITSIARPLNLSFANRPSGAWVVPSIALGGLVWIEVISAAVAHFC